MIQRRVKAARFPVFKELADFDFSAVPSLNKAQILDLARGEYLQKRESIIFIGNPGLGKTHLSTGLALAACRQKRKVRFWTAASLVNELCRPRMNIACIRFIAQALKLDLVVLDELGSSRFRPMAHRRCLPSARNFTNGCPLSLPPI
jgi:DNA replication protein DnaC